MVNRDGHTGWRFDNCSSEDIRFTRKDANLYAIALGWPADGKLTIHSLASFPVSSVEMLGAGPVSWTRTADAVVVSMPMHQPSKYAYVLKFPLL
jgi:alpha-L-fucosidase